MKDSRGCLPDFPQAFFSGKQKFSLPPVVPDSLV
jgi:hypothetical protein